MPVIVDGKKLIPAPFVNISESSVTNDAGKKLKKTFVITLSGTLLADRGSPNSSGVFWDQSGYPPDESKSETELLTSFLRKQEAIRKLFSTDGLLVEIQPLDGGLPLKFNPRVRGITFPADNWVTKCDYTIELEADQLAVTGTADGNEFLPFVSSTSNEWNIDITNEDNGVYRLTHTVSATGVLSYKEDGQPYRQAWENAEKYVLEEIGLGLDSTRMKAPNVLDAANLKAYNYIRSNSVNEESGVYGVTESWVCYDPGNEPPAIDTWTVNVRESIEDGLSQISIEGTVTGLEVRNNTTRALVSTKYSNAKSKFNDYVIPSLAPRIQSLTGLTINPTPLTKTTGHNSASGVISYSYEYNNRPGTTIPGATRESFRISNSNQTDVVATHVIPGRISGPYYQPVYTKTGRSLTVAVEAKFPAWTYGTSKPATPDVYTQLQAYKPTSSGVVFVADDQDDWDPINGNYSRRITWNW